MNTSHAQQTDNTQELETVVVTATRSAVSISNAPAAVTVVDKKQIEERNVSRVTDSLSKVPSLYLGRGENGQSNSSEGAFSLRGMTTNRTLVVMDGLQPLQNGNSQGVNWLTPFVDDIERVEVVPGAFGALYGSNAMGGVVNIISKRPDVDELKFRLKQGFGDASGTDTSVYFRKRFENGLGINAGLSRVDRDGYASEQTVRTLAAGAPGTAVNGAIPTTTREGVPGYIVGNRGKQPWTQEHALLRVSYDFNSTDRIYAGVLLSDAKQGYRKFNSYLTNAATGAPVSSGTLGANGQRFTLTESNFLGATPSIDSSNQYTAGYEGMIGKDTKFKFDIARIDRDYYFPTAGTAATWNGGAGTLTASPNSSLDATASLTFPIGERHLVVTGVSMHRDTVERRSYSLSNWRDPFSRTGVNNGYDGRSTTTSLFAQDEILINDQLTLYAGGRLDHWSTSGSFFQNTSPVTSIDYASRSDSAFNPKLSAVWKPRNDVTMRASWGKSFRSPSNFDLYSTTVNSSAISPTGFLTIQSDPKLKPERATSWEVGGDWKIADNSTLRATYYRTRLTDMIYSKQIDLSLTQRINAGAAQVNGVELGFIQKIAPWLSMESNVSWVDSKMLENSTDPGSVGKRLTQVPSKMAYLGLTAYQGPWTGIIEARYSGHVFLTAKNTDTVEGVPGSNDAYTMVNTKFGYAINKTTRLNLAINNLLDREVYNFALIPGRNASLELVISF